MKPIRQEIDQLEEETLKFLRENDPLFTSKKRKKLMEYNYHTERQSNIRRSTEIPLSNLSMKQKLRCAKLGDSIDFEEA